MHDVSSELVEKYSEQKAINNTKSRSNFFLQVVNMAALRLHKNLL